MNLRRKLLWLLGIFLVNTASAQFFENDPRTKSDAIEFQPTYEQLLIEYDKLHESNSEEAQRKARKADRWWNYSFQNYDVEEDGSYSMVNYNKAIQSIYTSPLNCGASDPANWVSDGPHHLPVGSHGQRGGWVDAVYNHPNNLDHFVIGTRTSGIMRTTNGGGNWTCVTDGLSFPVLGVQQIIAAPDDPDHLLAITGTITTWGGADEIEGGVILSTDGGANWSQISGAASLPQFYWLDYHPTISGLVFAAARDQLYYSSDDGLNWTALGAPPGYVTTYKKFFKVHVNSNNFFVNTTHRYQPVSELYKAQFSVSGSTVTISSWTNVSGNFLQGTEELTHNDFSNNVGSRFYLHAAARYITGYDANGDPIYSTVRRLYKTLDGGNTFTNLNISLYHGGFYKSELIASPNNSNVFYWGAIYEVKRYDETDQNPAASAVDFDDVVGNEGHHDDYRCSQILNINGADRLVFGNDGGPALVQNGLVTIPEMQSLNGDLSINLIHAFDVHEQTGRTVYAFQDHKMIYRDADLTYSNGYGFIHEGSAALIQQDYPDAIVGENAYSGIQDKDEIVHPIVDGTVGNGETYLGGYFVPYRHHPERFARGLRSTGDIIMNYAANTTVIVNIPIAENGIGPVAVCEHKVSTIYAADKDRRGNAKKLFKSTDDGATWSDLTEATVSLDNGNTTDMLKNLIHYNHIRALAVDHTDDDLLYCGIGETHDVNGTITDERFRVIKSTDGGSTFTDFSEGLPALPVERLLTIEDDKDLIFCATSVGIYYRNNDMSQWECFSKNLPKVHITGMKYNYCSRMLYASTYGRGMWKTPVDLPISSTYANEITSNTVWNQPMRINTNVLVKSGYTLEITDVVQLSTDVKIMVEAGAKLDINGGTLTSYCDDFWAGIEVWGDNSLSQNTATNQGQLIIRNQALIENAKNAINVWKDDSWSTTGGIVNATNSTFKNNWRSAAYYTYHYFSTSNPNFEYLNKGKFDNCVFTWDDDYFGVTIGPAITMYNVNGVKVIGCEFDDTRTGSVDRTTGIYTMDAGFLSIGKSLNLLGTPHDDYDETDYEVCVFKNLKTGIYAMNSNTQNRLVVDHCKFEDCLEGVHLSLVDNALVTRNKFVYTTDHPSDIASMNQLVLDRCTGFKVEGNLFESEVEESETIGVWTHFSGLEQNQIYRNTFTKLKTGNYATGRNQGGIFTGLQWLCNTYVSNEEQDQYVVGSNVPTTQAGIRYYQGGTDESAGNSFLNTYGNPTGRNHLQTDGLEHYYYLTATQDAQPPLPAQVQGAFFIWNGASSANQCPSSFSRFVVNHSTESMLTSQHESDFETEWSTTQSNLSLRVNELQTLNDAGNSNYLYQLVNNVTPANLTFTQQELISYSPYLSKDILEEVGKKSNSIFTHSWYKQLIDLNIEVAHDDDFMDFLQTKSPPLTPSLYNQIDQSRFTSATQRSEKEALIAQLEGEMAAISDGLIINELGKKSDADWSEYRTRITTRDDEVLRSQLADSYLNTLDLASCSSELQDITTNIAQYPADMQQEMTDFVTFKDYIVNIIDAQGGINNLGTSEYQQLKTYETTLSGRALGQVQNMLCFHFGECQSISTIANSSKSSDSETEENTDVEENPEELEPKISVIPNPNHGEFQLSLSGGFEIESVEILDVMGKIVPLKRNATNGNTADIVLLNAPSGTYFGLIKCKGGMVFRTTFVVH